MAAAVMFGFLCPLLLFFANLSNEDRKEQRATLKFFVKSGFSPIECWRRLRNVWKDNTMCKTQVRFWHKRFLNGETGTAHKRPGRPHSQMTPENINKVSQLLQEEGKLTLREICRHCDLKMGVVVRIVKKELKLKRRALKFMPTELTQAQKQTRVEVSQKNIDTLCSSANPETFLQSIVTGDEMWINTCEQETKMQSSVWLAAKAPRPRKALRIPGNKKTMLTLFCDAKGVILMDWLEPKEKIDSARYLKTLSKLKECLRQKRPELWKERQFIVHHDNTSPHTSFETMGQINKWQMEILPHPPNSPDLAPCDYGFFPKLKADLRGKRFNTVKELQKAVRKILLSWPPQVFSDIMHNLVSHWQKCVAAQGEYFEGTAVEFDPLFVQDGGATESESSEED